MPVTSAQMIALTFIRQPLVRRFKRTAFTSDAAKRREPELSAALAANRMLFDGTAAFGAYVLLHGSNVLPLAEGPTERG